MNAWPKLLIGAGVVLIVLGLIGWLASRFFPLGRLPGDIVIDKGPVKFYFPVVTCILLSAVLSLIAYVVRKLMK